MDINDEQMDIFGEAFDLYQERNAVHRDLWKQDGVEGAVEHIRHKLARLKSTMMTTRADELTLDQMKAQFTEDALDLINYTAFAIRNMRDGRIQIQE